MPVSAGKMLSTLKCFYRYNSKTQQQPLLVKPKFQLTIGDDTSEANLY